MGKENEHTMTAGNKKRAEKWLQSLHCKLITANRRQFNQYEKIEFKTVACRRVFAPVPLNLWGLTLTGATAMTTLCTRANTVNSSQHCPHCELHKCPQHQIDSREDAELLDRFDLKRLLASLCSGTVSLFSVSLVNLH